MRALAGLLACDASNITGLVDRLEAQGLVSRHLDPGDRRVKNVVATEKGVEVVRLIRAGMRATSQPSTASTTTIAAPLRTPGPTAPRRYSLTHSGPPRTA